MDTAAIEDAVISTPPSAPKIHAAMCAIMADVGAVAKGRRNQQQGYNFRGIDDLYQACQLVMAKHGVYSLPCVVEQAWQELETKSGGAMHHCRFTVDITFRATDGSAVTARVVGEAMDTGDKSSNKAMSQADKYALIQAFKIPTDDPKADTEADDPPEAKRMPPKEQPQAPTSAASVAPGVKSAVKPTAPALKSIAADSPAITPGEVKALAIEMTGYGMTGQVECLEWVAKQIGRKVASRKDLTQGEYKMLMGALASLRSGVA
jgi:hypothetical protein